MTALFPFQLCSQRSLLFPFTKLYFEYINEQLFKKPGNNAQSLKNCGKGNTGHLNNQLPAPTASSFRKNAEGRSDQCKQSQRGTQKGADRGAVMFIYLYLLIQANAQQLGISYMTIEYNLAMSQSIGQHPDLQSIRLWIADPQHINKVEAFVDQHYANSEVLQHLLGLIVSNTAQYSSPLTRHHAFQSYGCILNRMLDKYFNILPSSEIAAIGIHTCFKMLFTWQVPYSFKKCLVTSFVSLLNTSKAIIGDFFEDAWDILIRMVAQLESFGVDCSEKVLESRLVHQVIGMEFVISLSSVASRQDIFHTLILIGQGFFLRDDFKENQKSQERLIENFKKIHQMLFKQENIDKYLQVFRQLFTFWRDFNAIGLDRNRSMRPSFESISRWGSLLSNLELILNYKSPKVSNNCFIYFMFTDDQQSNKKLVDLKKQALDVFNDMLAIEKDALQAPLIETSFGQNIGNICRSIVASLEFLVVNKQTELDECIENLTNQMLLTLDTVVGFECFFHQETLNDILFRILLPMIDSELQDLEIKCEDNEDLKDILDHLNDCCQDQQKMTMLSISCKILEIIAQDSQIRFILRTNSFIALIEHLQIANELSYQPEIKLNFSVPTAFLMLVLLQFDKEEMQMERNLMKVLVAPERFRQLSAWNKRFSFLYISHTASLFEDDQPQLLDFYMHYCIDHPLIDKDPFLYDLVANICPHYSSQQTAKLFYSSLTKSENSNLCNEKFSVFSIIIKKYLNIFSQEKIVKLIEILLLEIGKRVKYTIDSIMQLTKYQLSPGVPFSILTQISTDHEYIKDKPNIIRALFSTMDLMDECAKINAEDYLVTILGNVIEATHILPDNFENMLVGIKQTFQGSEFKGQSYYHFFGQAIDIISSYINDNTNEQQRDRGVCLAEKMFDILVEGFAYFATFPDGKTKEIYIAISCFEVIFQKMLILLGDTLPEICIQEIKGLCATLLASFEGTRHYFLRSRTQNLRFICEFLSTKDYQFQKILKMVSSLHYSCGKEAILFIFLASKIRAELPQDQQLLLVLIILYYLQSNFALKNASVQIRQMMCKQNSIFNYIYLPFEICNTPLLQARAFFAGFEEEDPEMKAKIMGSLNREIYANLSHIIELIFKQGCTQAEQFNDEINEMTSAQLDECSDGSQSYYSDEEEEEKLAKRRYVKVVERTSESTPNHFVGHQIIAKKRQFEREATNDLEEETNGEVVQTHRKRRKIEEMQPEKIKKEIMREKKNRKIQRL